MADRRPYVPRGYTRKPCPGCSEERVRLPTSVCDVCRGRFRQLDELLAARAAAGADRVPFRWPWAAHGLPYPYHAGDQVDALRNAFYALGLSISTPTTEHPPQRKLDPRDTYEQTGPEWYAFDYTTHRDDRGHVRETRAFVPAQAEAMRAAYAAARAAIVHAYADGHTQGRNLLGQLAAGEITMDAFNDRALREEARL